jgi:hypothetical protein
VLRLITEAPARPMNERGLRARFLPGSGSATSIQQDRLRKCSLAPLHRIAPTKEVDSKKDNRKASKGQKLKVRASCTRC